MFQILIVEICISVVSAAYRVVVYNVFIERGNIGVLSCSVPSSVSDHVQVLSYVKTIIR